MYVSSCKRKTCYGLSIGIVHTDTEIVDPTALKVELQIGSDNRTCEHADSIGRIRGCRSRDVVPGAAVERDLYSELCRVKIALRKVAERKGTSELRSCVCEGTQIIAEPYESAVVRSGRSIRGEVLRRILQSFGDLLETVIRRKACRTVPWLEI